MPMSPVEHIERLVLYYQDFHHKLLTWYITVIGFFIAGVLAAPIAPSTPSSQVLGGVMVVFSVSFAVLFLWCIAVYGGRIRYLNDQLQLPAAQVPENWRACHRDAPWLLSGMGTLFFMLVVLGMQVALISLVCLRYGL
jgi:hypothetical protein